MISEIDFSHIGKSENFKYAVELDYFKNNQKMQFQPGLNIIYAPNGTGKSTILKAMAQYTACEQGGVSTITSTWVQDVMGHGDKSKLEGITLAHDGQAVMYANPRNAVGLFGGMAAFDDDFISQGIQEVQLKQSTGLTTLYRIQKILAVLNGKAQTPQAIARKTHLNSQGAAELLKATIAQGQKTLLLDEPESGLAVHVQHNLWRMMENGALKHNLQIIVATHSPFALSCTANYIELTPGYLKQSRDYAKMIGRNIEMAESHEAEKTQKIQPDSQGESKEDDEKSEAVAHKLEAPEVIQKTRRTTKKK